MNSKNANDVVVIVGSLTHLLRLHGFPGNPSIEKSVIDFVRTSG